MTEWEGGLAPPAQALTAAVGETQKLLSGAEGRSHWRRLAHLAVLAGVVGVGVQPPPLGFLEPLLGDGEARTAVLAIARPASAVLGALSLALLLMAPLARAYGLALIHASLCPEQPSRGARDFLGPGARHFVWSSLFTVPLYWVLFAGEARLLSVEWLRITKAAETGSEAALQEVLSTAAPALLLQYFLLLFPWVVLTLPVMVFLYELVPVTMVMRGGSPTTAGRCVLRVLRAAPARAAGYFGIRLLLQAGGTTLMLLASIPCLIVSALAGSPLLGAVWWGAERLGGVTTVPGAALVAAVVLLVLALFYCLLCGLVVPLSVLPYHLSVGVLTAPTGRGAPGCGGGRPPGDPTSRGSGSLPAPR